MIQGTVLWRIVYLVHWYSKLMFSGNAYWRGKAQYSWPPCTNKFRPAFFENAKIIYFFTKQATLIRRSNVLSLSLRLAFPGSFQTFFHFLSPKGKGGIRTGSLRIRCHVLDHCATAMFVSAFGFLVCSAKPMPLQPRLILLPGANVIKLFTAINYEFS
jgi:hypothetical protein